MTANQLKKIQAAVTKVLDGILVFGSGALLDPGVHDFIGKHQGVGTVVLLGIALLRAADKALGGKASAAALAEYRASKANETPAA